MRNKIKLKETSLIVSEGIGRVSMLITTPKNIHSVLVLAHGAGAGMTHKFMEALATDLAEQNIACVRYNFPYVENGRKRPDAPGIAEKTVEKVIEFTHDMFPQVLLFAGGKSFGGRMTSQRISKGCPPYVKGIVFYGFPLHPTGSPSTDRAKHLSDIKIPMLFLQGSKDTLADLTLLEGVIENLPTAHLEIFEGADHSFNRGKINNIPQLAEKTENWMRNCSI
jgi:predicted alpha/beta-hydrolase family hydrolase